ncbi:hypothetical protein G8S49_09795 [Clostridium botulinum C]|uniref:Adenosine deaminase domain-containing protein n=2 Tax=Clostridium botulinum TaxID=1491 RepID=A0A9Q4XYF6_CLOBO|nr:MULTISPECIES: hypothetical protein [Clostridium]KEI07626.1 hypothetical protein Z957_07845 [Clostridium sp. K25]MCD3195552.1 hypothetical protein [Clostridium botulinum C]MCD3200968.1 hypothetical protein [Clostridium botulinum C]MCD3206376.1 hypothetical protein [Clostridium botulinum C]MCD3208828.1 hypothetical protein [Clostridium botulinum C]
MFNKKLSLTANMCILPFVIFYKSRCVDEICKIEEINKYKKELSKYYAEIYKSLKNTCIIINFDEVNLLFDKFYPKEELNNYKNNISKFYMKVLSKLAKSFISHRDGKIVFKYWKSDGEEDYIGPYSGINKIAFWNYLNRIFTTDLLVVRYLLDNGMEDERNLEGFTSTIMLADSQLELALKKGVAETHIHKNAAINFYISWQDLMNLKGKSKSNYTKKILSSNIFYDEINLVPYILSISIVRFIMASFLQYRINESWEDFINSEYRHEEDLKISYYGYINEEYKNIKKLCCAIADGKKIEENEYDFFKLWTCIEEKFNIISDANEKKALYKNDILKYIFKNYGDNNIILENILLFKAMNYIDNNNDIIFGKIFMNYLRIKNKILQTKVQSNLVKGLINFKYYFKRSISKTYNISAPYEERNYWKILIENQLQNLYLKKLELRAGIANGNLQEIKKSIKNVLINFLVAYKDVLAERKMLYGEKAEYPQIALVFHLQKIKDKHEYEKCWVNFEYDEYRELYFIEHREVYSKQVQALNLIREEYKGVSDYIVGLDAASSENDTEPWVFAPIYEKARDSKRGDLIYKNSSNPNRIKSLGFTFHVGEDFRHIVTGLRRIDEVIDNFKFHAGDRIGHGIALGINIDKWIKNNRVVTLPRIEYMENMLWIWGIYKDGYYDEAFDISYLEQEIMIHAEKIFGSIEGITIYVLWKVYKNKFYEFKPNKELISYNTKENSNNNRLFCRYGNSERSIIWNIETLTHANHCVCYLKKMLEPIQVEVKYDKKSLFKQLQKIVCHKISTKAIVVETNPTSNLAIGEIESIFEHYIHNLNNTGLLNNSEKENSMIVTINSDDPSVFNTNVSNELAYIFYSLEEKGYDREKILQWIDKVRQYGMDSSFISDSNLSISDKITEIENLINELKQ